MLGLKRYGFIFLPIFWLLLASPAHGAEHLRAEHFHTYEVWTDGTKYQIRSSRLFDNPGPVRYRNADEENSLSIQFLDALGQPVKTVSERDPRLVWYDSVDDPSSHKLTGGLASLPEASFFVTVPDSVAAKRIRISRHSKVSPHTSKQDPVVELELP